jgi:hypothetical protein
MDMSILHTIKAKQIECIEEVLKSIAEQIVDENIFLEQVKDLFNKNNFVYRDNTITIKSLLLSIVLFDISGQYDKYFREENIFKIKKICNNWNLEYDYICEISSFHKDLIDIFEGKK